MQFDTCCVAVTQRPLVAVRLERHIEVGQAEERQHCQVRLPMPTMGRRIDQDTITSAPQAVVPRYCSVGSGKIANSSGVCVLVRGDRLSYLTKAQAFVPQVDDVTKLRLIHCTIKCVWPV